MKRTVCFLLPLFLLGGVASSIDLLPVGQDMENFLERLGQETIPFIQQNALAGEGLGIAQFGDDTGFYFSITPAAVVFTHGIFDFATDGGTFEVLNVDGLIQSRIEESEIVESFIDGTFPFFSIIRLNLGFALPQQFELSFMFSMIPQFLTDIVTGAVGFEGLTLNSWTAGARLRRPLISDSGGFPAISLGVGYTLSNFNLEIDLPEDFTQDISGSPMTLSGDLSVTTWLHTFGVDLAFSKKLSFFVPFVKLSSYYQITSYNGKAVDFEAVAAGDRYTDQAEEDPEADLNISDLSFFATTGFELLFGKFAIVFTGHYGITTNALGADLALRLGF